MKGKNNDALKKHHFWILAGLAPLMVFLAVIFMMTGVSEAIDKKIKEVQDNEKTVSSAQAPGTGILKDLDKKKELLEKVRGELWKINWDKQANYFTWPETTGQVFDRYNTMKFGAKHRDFIQDPRLGEQLKPAYADAYDKLGNSVAPTKMKGGWQSVLRYVGDWGPRQPDSQQLWIVMEDYWMQKALLNPISVVNHVITDLKPVPPLNTPLKRKFASRIWEIDLEVAPNEGRGGGRVLKGRIKNRTNQLQVLGLNSAMRLKVWFDPKTLYLPPYEFRIEGSGVAGGESIEIPPLPSHVLPPNLEVIELAKVEQSLDDRTVPIRRLDRLAIGYLSSKDYTKELKPGSYWVESAESTAAATPMGFGTEGSVPSPGRGGGLPGSPDGGGLEGPGSGGTMSSGTVMGRSGGMRLIDVADGSHKRYLEVTEQLRRVPIALSLVVDQMYINDVLIAYANSALRFETSQVHWSRFNESLAEAPGAGGIPGGSGDPYGEGMTATATGYAGAGLMPSMRGGGSVGPAAMSITPGSPGSGSPSGSFGEGGPGMYSSSMMTGGIPGLNPDTLSSVSAGQANAGLVQLTIYGIVTVYERYEPPATDPSMVPAASDPMPMDPMNPSTPMDPMPPMNPTAPATTPNPMTPSQPMDTGKPMEPTKPMDTSKPMEPKPMEPEKKTP